MARYGVGKLMANHERQGFRRDVACDGIAAIRHERKWLGDTTKQEILAHERGVDSTQRKPFRDRDRFGREKAGPKVVCDDTRRCLDGPDQPAVYQDRELVLDGADLRRAVADIEYFDPRSLQHRQRHLGVVARAREAATDHVGQLRP